MASVSATPDLGTAVGEVRGKKGPLLELVPAVIKKRAFLETTVASSTTWSGRGGLCNIPDVG